MEAYKNPNLTPAERTEDLLSRMTLEEKVAQLVGDGAMSGEIPNIEKKLPHGAGHINGTFLFGDESAEAKAKSVEKIQKYMVEGTRLGIPTIVHMEETCGSFFPGAAASPIAIAMGATFDSDTVEKMGSIVGREDRAMGFHQGFGPVMELVRDSRWGRMGESYGEDATHCSKMAAAYVRGLQGCGDLSQGVAATGKHFVAYGTSDGGRNIGNQRVTDRDLRQNHLRPWKAAIDAGMLSVMNSYGLIDGEPAAQSKYLLTELLKKELGFQGLVVSDYCSINRAVDDYGTECSLSDAGISSLKAGMDMELPDPMCFNDEFVERIKSGEVPIELIDNAVRRVLLLKFKLGIFEKPYPDYEKIAQYQSNKENRQIPAKLAREAVVLTKNNGVLPLKPGMKIAVIGPDADRERAFFGGYMYVSMLEMKAMMSKMFTGMQGTDGAVEASKTKDLVKLGDINEEIRSRYPGLKSIFKAVKEYSPDSTTVMGCEITGNDRSGFQEAVQLAKEADAVVMVLGGRGGWTQGCTSGEGIDMPYIGVPGVQAELFESVKTAGKPMVVVHTDVRPMSEPDITSQASAVVEIWHLGSAGGEAVADILFGKVSPSGRLPVTCAAGLHQLPVYFGAPRGTSGIERPNMPGEKSPYAPLFRFGHGLSYVDFEYSDIRVSDTVMNAAGSITISLNIKNTGDITADEVVQLYFSDVLSSLARPDIELADYKRITLDPGQTKTVEFVFSAQQAAIVGLDKKWIVEPGEIKLMIGSASDDIRLNASVEIQ